MVLYLDRGQVDSADDLTEAVVGVTRLRLANEGSIRANIDRMIGEIIEAQNEALS